MKIGKCILALGFLLLCDTAAAQSGVKRASTSPFEKQFLVEFSSGASLIADYSTSRVYVYSVDGTQHEVTFSDAIAAVESNTAKRNELLNTFRTSLTDPQHLATVRKPRIATDDTYWPKPKWCGKVICIDPYSGTDRSAGNVASSMACDFKCEPEDYFPCDMGPCHPNHWDLSGNFFYSGFGGSWEQNKGGGNVTQQDLVAYDKQQFEKARKDACGDKVLYAAETAAIGANAVYACKNARSVGGIAVCAGSAIVYSVGLYKTNKANKECQAEYPGLGNW